MQDEYGQVLEAQSISAGLDYPGVGPEHSLPRLDRAGRVPGGHRRRGDRRVPAAGPHRGHHPRPRVRPRARLDRPRGADAAGPTVLMNLSGRGDKDVAQMMDILGPMTGSSARDRVPRQAVAAGRKLLVPYITGGLTGWQDAVRARGRRRRRRDRDRHPVLRSGDGRPGHPAGIADGARGGRHAGVDPRRGRDARRRHPAGGDDVLQHRPPRRPRAVRPSAASRPASPPRSCPTCRSRSPGRGARRPTRRHRDGDARRADRARRAAAADRRTGARVRLLGRVCSASPASATSWPPRRRRWPRRVKAITDVPVLVGVGVSNAAQAAEAVQVADGVVRARRSCAGCWTAAPMRSATTSPRCAPPSMNEVVRAVRGGASDGVVLRGRGVLDRRMRAVLRADGGVEAARSRPHRTMCAQAMLAVLGRSGAAPRTGSTATTSTTTCARSRTTTTPTPARGAASSVTGCANATAEKARSEPRSAARILLASELRLTDTESDQYGWVIGERMCLGSFVPVGCGSAECEQHITLRGGDCNLLENSTRNLYSTVSGGSCLTGSVASPHAHVRSICARSFP